MAFDIEALRAVLFNAPDRQGSGRFPLIARGICRSLLDSTEVHNMHATDEPIDELISLLQHALRSDPSGKLHEWHICFFQVCLKFGRDSVAYELASRKWASFEKSLHSLEILELCYYSALVFIRSREYSKARVCLLKALAMPGNSLSVVQVSCLRKLCLVDLILFGEVRALPGWLAKSNQHMTQLYDGARMGNQATGLNPDFSPEKAPARSNRPRSGSSHTGEALDVANPDVVCPSALSDIVRTFMNPSSSAADVNEVVKNSETALRKGRDWGLAIRLALAKRRHSLNRLAKVFDRMLETDIQRLTACRTSDEFSELVTDFNSWSPSSGISIQLGDEGYWVFNRSHCESAFEALSSEMSEFMKHNITQVQ